MLTLLLVTVPDNVIRITLSGTVTSSRVNTYFVSCIDAGEYPLDAFWWENIQNYP